MKILQICQSFYPCFASGGVVRSVYELSNRLVEQGHDVTVYTTDGCTQRLEGDNHTTVDVGGIKVFYLKNLSNSLKLKFKISNPYYLPFRAKKDLKEFDVVHIHEYRSFLSVSIHHYAKKYGVPYVLQARGSVMPFFAKTRMKKVFDQLWGREILNDAKVVLALTPVESQQYEKMGVDPDKIRIIPNGIDTSIQNMVSSGNFRKDYSLNNDEKIILFLGRLHKIKGIDLLVEAFNDLVTELDEVRLVIAGPDDGCLRFLEKMVKDYEIEDKVLFTGPLYDNKKYEAYIDADVYVLPSRYETFPNTVLESAIFRTPVIVTDRCGIADLVEDNMGLVVKWDKESLKEGICSLIMDEKRGNEFGDKGKFFVSENLDSTIVARKIENLYKSIIKN